MEIIGFLVGSHPFSSCILKPAILVPTAHDPSGLRQGSRALGWSNTGSPRFTDFPSNLANLTGLEYETKSGPARALDPCRRPEGSWALGTKLQTRGLLIVLFTCFIMRMSYYLCLSVSPSNPCAFATRQVVHSSVGLPHRHIREFVVGFFMSLLVR